MDVKNFQEWTSLAKHHKQMWVEATERGDMPPTVLGIKNGQPELLVVAGQIDKHEGLKAIDILRRGIGIDEVLLIVDAHTILTKGKSKEEIERLHEKYTGKPGSMQKACDEEDACAVEEIGDCLNVLFLDKERRFHMATFVYAYHGKDGGVDFRWMPEHDTEMLDCEIDFNLSKKIDKLKENAESEPQEKPIAKVGGFVPTTMYRLMEQPSMIEDEKFNVIAKAFLGSEPDDDVKEKAVQHAGVAIRRLLHENNYLVMETLAYDGSYRDFVKKMADKYLACMRAYEIEPEEFLQHIEQELDAIEAKAKADNDTTVLTAVAQMRAVREQRKA
jgi:hypothetical protein